MSVGDARTPLLVLTGFLGSGKTTLLNRLLCLPALGETAVLVNEFGEVGLDHHLVESRDETLVLLDNGCVCCAVREDLRAAILALHDRRARGEIPAYTRIVLETSGLADPVPVLHTLANDPQLAAHYRVARVIATVDAVHGGGQLARHVEAHRQVAVADTLVVTKSDLVAAAALDALNILLGDVNPLAEVTDARQVALHALFDVESATPDPLPSPVAHDGGTGVHGHGYRTFCLCEASAIDWPTFALWLTLLLHAHGSRILRVKGLLEIEGVATPVLVDAVQHVVHAPRHLSAWPDAQRGTRLVFILQDLAPQALADSLAAFRVAAAAISRPAADAWL